MTYPTPPGPRIMYDEDGSIGFYSSDGGVRQAAPQWLTAMNSDGPNEAGVATGRWLTWPTLSIQNVPLNAWFGIRFPVATRIRAVAASLFWGETGGYALNYVVEASADSTNGEDGTWGIIHSSVDQMDFPVGNDAVVEPELANFVTRYHDGDGASSLPLQSPRLIFGNRRNEFSELGVGWHPTFGAATRQVFWVRVRVTGRHANMLRSDADANPPTARPTMKLHLYGEPDTTADTDRRLEFVTTGGSTKLFFDFGDVTAGETLIQQFRIKNLSSSETADEVYLQIHPANPSLTTSAPDDWCRLSLDGVIWGDVIGPLTIDPGDVSDIITLRVISLPNIYGPWSPRLQAYVEEWV